MNRTELLKQFELDGRTAIITGGSRGIGEAIASGFAAVGANVVVASRKVEACERVAEAIRSQGGNALAVPTHVGDLAQLDELTARTVKEFGGIDIVVNNAANPLAESVGSISPEAFAKSYEVNLRGPLFLVQSALPHLRASGHGSIINMVTAGVFTQGPHAALYISSKAALRALTASMAAELADDGIRVNAIAPGTVATDMVLNMPEEFQAAAVDAQLIRRMAAPEEIVPAALFLASGASSFVTGQTLVVDGGMTTH